MIIKKVSTEQFAGIRDREVTFSDGINVVYGKNESGKSTLVNLISRTLFQDAKTDRRRDKEFLSRYFPTETKGSSAKNGYIQGKVVFEAEDGEYIVTKEWGDDPVCKLSAPSGMIKNQSDINAELKKVLCYGEGIYSEMLFSSQHNTDISLQSILNSSENTDAKKEITEVVTKAFSESDGISAENIEKAIDKKIDDLEGKHWDRENNVPMRKAVRWISGIGEVHKAYHDFLDAKENIDKISELENNVSASEAKFKTAKAAKTEAEEKYSKFIDFANFLSTRGERKKNLERLEADLLEFRVDAEKWPETAKNLKRAEILAKEKHSREILNKYEEAKPVFEAVSALKKKLEEMRCPSEKDISDAKQANARIETLKNKLCGINLSAAVRMFGGNNLEVKSLVTGENLYNGEDNIIIKEAVSLKIPGVMEMQLAPANINFKETEQDIIKNKTLISGILIKYGVPDIASLENLAKSYIATENEIRINETRLDRITGFIPFAELENESEKTEGEIREMNEIENEIRKICGYEDISSFITKSGVIISSFENAYISPENLHEKIETCKKEISAYKESEKEAENIPEEYLGISDPQAYLKALKDSIDAAGNSCDIASGERTAALVNLSNYIEIHPDPKAALEKAERIFGEKSTLLKHWIHIKKIFGEVREEFRGNPMEKLSESFTDYLGMISGERISSEFPDEEKLEMEIYSGKNKLDYGKLSEGTKETVSLAFRLAVLDHLFPDGGGVIVFDDPFTDMDAERTAKSCELIKKCAEKHQVIFLTCNEDYKKMLSGKVIDI